MTTPEMSPPTGFIQCRLVGGPFDQTESDDYSGTRTIRMRAGPGDFFAVYRRPNPDEMAEDGRTVFHFDTLIEDPTGVNSEDGVRS